MFVQLLKRVFHNLKKRMAQDSDKIGQKSVFKLKMSSLDIKRIERYDFERRSVICAKLSGERFQRQRFTSFAGVTEAC